MLSSSIEMIAMAASNSLLVFCFFNFLIMAILLLGSTMPTTPQTTTSTCIVYNNGNKEEEEEEEEENKLNSVILSLEPTRTKEEYKPPNFHAEKPTKIPVQAMNKKRKIVDDPAFEMNKYLVYEECEDKEEEDEELRRRVEEFIAKVNKGWREEKLRGMHI